VGRKCLFIKRRGRDFITAKGGRFVLLRSGTKGEVSGRGKKLNCPFLLFSIPEAVRTQMNKRRLDAMHGSCSREEGKSHYFSPAEEGGVAERLFLQIENIKTDSD